MTVISQFFDVAHFIASQYRYILFKYHYLYRGKKYRHSPMHWLIIAALIDFQGIYHFFQGDGNVYSSTFLGVVQWRERHLYLFSLYGYRAELSLSLNIQVYVTCINFDKCVKKHYNRGWPGNHLVIELNPLSAWVQDREVLN